VRPYLEKNPSQKRAGGMAQVSNPDTPRKKERERILELPWQLGL
jgi:hypothetical protein